MHEYAQVAVDLFCENSHLSIVVWWFAFTLCHFSCIVKLHCTIRGFIFIDMGSWGEGTTIEADTISAVQQACMLSSAFFALYINLIFLTKPYNTVDPNSKIIACLLQQLGYAVKPIIHRTILRDAFNLVCGCPEYCHLKCWLLINLHCHSDCFLLSLPGY